MHQRSWLSLLTLPLVAGFTYPLVAHRIPTGPQAPAQIQDPLAGMADIQDVISLIRDNYVDPPDLSRVLAGGIQATLERAHPLNSYLSPEDLHAPDPGPASVGLRVVKRGNYGHVLAVAPGSPAAKGGILPGDVLGKVDGRSLSSLNAWHLERRLRGAQGSALTLSVISAVTGQTRKVELVRELVPRLAVTLRQEGRATVVALPDLDTGRADELARVLGAVDPARPLLVDLRYCGGGSLEEARRVAGMLQLQGAFATLQASGQPDRQISVQPTLGPAWVRVGLLTGPGTAGPAELLAVGFKEAGRPTYGHRTASLGVGLTRIPLRHGGAVELVTERWRSPKGLRLDRDPIRPAQELLGLRPDEDPVPRVVEQLTTAAPLPAQATRAWLSVPPASVWRQPVTVPV